MSGILGEQGWFPAAGDDHARAILRSRSPDGHRCGQVHQGRDTADDALGSGNNNANIVSKIASVTVKGHIFGSSDSAESWGFIAQSIGKFTRDKTAYTLHPAATPLDLFNVSLQGNVLVREVA